MSRLIALLFFGLAACTDPPPPRQPIPETVSGTAAPSEAERADVLRQTYQYWGLIGDRQWARAYAFHALDYRAHVPFPEFRNGRNAAWARPPQVTRIRWQQGMNRLAGPELYAVVEWQARVEARGALGRLIWRQEPDGSFLISHSEVRVLRPR